MSGYNTHKRAKVKFPCPRYSTAPLIPTRWWWVVNFTTRPLYSKKTNTETPEHENGRAPELVCVFRRRRNIAPAGIRNPDYPSSSLVTILFRLISLWRSHYRKRLHLKIVYCRHAQLYLQRTVQNDLYDKQCLLKNGHVTATNKKYFVNTN